MRLIFGVVVATLVVAALVLWQVGHYGDVMRWAVEKQRVFQNELASFIMAARRGESGVVWGLIGASALYGFVHALGPGHGKFLIGSAGLGSHATARTMAALAIVSALAQGLTAVVLVYGGLALLSVGTGWAVRATDEVLTPLSYGVIALIGVVLVWRGLKTLAPRLRAALAPAPVHAHAHGHSHHVHDDACGCGHKHGPTIEEVQNLRGWRDAVALIAGIAIRPCTGAVMVLVIAWQTGLHVLGFGAVIAMALGTGAFTALVALASVSFREASFFASGPDGSLSLVAPALQVVAGGFVLLFSAGLLWASLT